MTVKELIAFRGKAGIGARTPGAQRPARKRLAAIGQTAGETCDIGFGQKLRRYNKRGFVVAGGQRGHFGQRGGVAPEIMDHHDRAPMRTSSGTCMKRFSKMFSVTRLTPSAWVTNAIYWACISVGKPGYSSVDMLAAHSFPAARTRTVSGPSTSTRTPVSSSLAITAPRCAGITVCHDQVAARNGPGYKKCPRFDPVRIDAIVRAMEAAERPAP